MDLWEFMRDERGRESISRLGPFAYLGITVAACVVSLVSKHSLPVFDQSWLYLGGVLLATYGAAKKIGGDQALAQAKPAPATEVE